MAGGVRRRTAVLSLVFAGDRLQLEDVVFDDGVDRQHAVRAAGPFDSRRRVSGRDATERHRSADGRRLVVRFDADDGRLVAGLVVNRLTMMRNTEIS